MKFAGCLVRSWRHSLLWLLTFVLPFLLQPIQAQSTLFELLEPGKTGLQFENTISETEGLNVLAYEYFYNGAGLAVGDLDNDGLDDLVFTANMRPNKVFRNIGGLHFKDMTPSIGAGIEGRLGGWKTGVTLADVNNDGLLDIYICYSGKVELDQRRNQLFINLGNWKFREAAAAMGIDDPSYSTQAAFFDYDRDGDLDMFLLNHSIKKVDNLEFARYRNEIDSFAGCKLYENEGGHFHDVSANTGINRSGLTFGLGVVVADINMDGWPDLYVTNDYNEPDHLYLNNKNKTFTDAGDKALSHMSQFSMGADIADFNNDGLPDIMSLDMLPEDNRRQKLLQLQENYEVFELMQQQGLHKQYMRNMLQLNNGDGTFSEIAQLAGVSKTDWSWTPLFADFDNDGFKDLFITNGYLRDYTNKDFLRYWGDYKVKKAVDREPVLLMDLISAMPSTKVPNYIFRNNGDLTFSNKQKEWGIDRPVISSAAVFADLDNDGDLELVVNNSNEPSFLYRNLSRENTGSHYLSIQVRQLNKRPAVGAKVFVYTKGLVQYVETGQCRGYLSAASTGAHFGLGDKRRVDSVRVVWPDGTVWVTGPVEADRRLVVEHPISVTQSFAENKSAPALLQKLSFPIDYKHESFGENDFKRQLLMLFMYSQTGPVIARGDVNKDGRDDLFISGTAKEPGKVHVQEMDGRFTADTIGIVNEEEAAVAAAAFIDVNNDNWPDLYIAKGGYSIWMPNTPALQDELYVNDGKGHLLKVEGWLPDMSSSSKSCVRPADIDGDGDLDIFVGGRIIPGRYPVSPESFLLINDGKGHFSKNTVPFDHIGMVSDAAWSDINKDGRPDLFLAGEFMPLMVFLNLSDGFENATDDYIKEPLAGMWNAIKVEDFNGDGQPDILAGNVGRNTPFQVSDKEPAELVYADFDENGSVDPFFCFYFQGKSYPYVSRDELNEQLYAMRRKFLSYKQYADATLADIFNADELSKAITLTANEQETVLLLQKDGGYGHKEPLPVQAQFSLVRQLLTADFNHDGYKDILLLGNQTPNRLKMGAIDANRGCLLLGDGSGHFRYDPQPSSGLNVEGDVKSGLLMRWKGRQVLLAGATEKELQVYGY